MDTAEQKNDSGASLFTDEHKKLDIVRRNSLKPHPNRVKNCLRALIIFTR
jgi:hypothetical protein